MRKLIRCGKCGLLIGIINEKTLEISHRGRKVCVHGYEGSKYISIVCERCKEENKVYSLEN